MVLLSAPARAEGPPTHIAIRLAYDHGPGIKECPSERGVRDALMEKFGYDPTDPSPIPDFQAPLLRVSLSRRGGELHAHGQLINSAGDVLWGDTYQGRITCEGLVRIFALVIKIGIDAADPPRREALAQVVPPAPPPVPVPVPVPAPVTVPVPAPSASPSIPPPPPPPPKRSLQVVVGLDGIFTPVLAPSASAGFALWAGVDLLNAPLSFELDVRSTWSLVPAQIPLAYQPLFAVRTSYVGGVLAGCWRGPLSLCPVLEVGRMSYSEAGTIGVVSQSSILVAAGLRGVYARPLTERFVLRGLFEVEGLLQQPFLIADYTGHRESTPSPVSLTWGIGFGGSL